jgi:citrate lyase beta subunit
MFREFSYLELGATLYTPSINKHILLIANGEKFSYLKSVVFCLEDAIKESDLEEAFLNLQNMLDNYKRSNIKVFVRPRNSENFKKLLKLKAIEKIDGFAFAKFGSENMKEYFNILETQESKYHIMPVIESTDMFDSDRLKQIRDFLLTKNKHHILTLRIGGEDMFKALGLKKRCEDSIHDFHISSKVFADIFSIFKPYGFNITAPVYNCLENKELFIKEVSRDIKEGFFGKTVIHPDQAKFVNDIYTVSNDEYEEAKAILDSTNAAIFRFENRMCEPLAHNIWARNILERSRIYGILN